MILIIGLIILLVIIAVIKEYSLDEDNCLLSLFTLLACYMLFPISLIIQIIFPSIRFLLLPIAKNVVRKKIATAKEILKNKGAQVDSCRIKNEDIKKQLKNKYEKYGFVV